MASERIVLEAGGREVSLSSPDRVVWPEQGITKRELAEYLIAVADPFLAHNGDRPVSLERFPASVDGDSFFSKNPPKGAPDFVESVPVTYNSGRRHRQLVLTEAAAIVWAAQMNAVVFHPWASLAADTDPTGRAAHRPRIPSRGPMSPTRHMPLTACARCWARRGSSSG